MERHMTIQQMRYFAAVYRTGNYSKAAEELYVSQPSVTMAMKELEEEAGRPLFYRQGNKKTLTDAGQILYEEVKRTLEQIDRLDDLMHSDALDRNFVRLGFSTMVGNTAAPQICRAFKQSNPDIRIISAEDSGRKLLIDLSEGKLDVVITGKQYSMSETWKDRFRTYDLTNSGMVFCVHRDHPLAGKQTVSLEELAAGPLIMPSERFPAATGYLRRFYEHSLTPNILLTTSQIFTIERFIQYNVGCGLLPEEYVKSQDELCPVNCPQITENTDLVTLYWDKKEIEYPAVKKFISCARKMYAHQDQAR